MIALAWNFRSLPTFLLAGDFRVDLDVRVALDHRIEADSNIFPS
jgi:hypothetical protein